jgi:hypothetical protein
MNKLKNIFLSLLSISFCVAFLTTGSAYGDNSNAAKGKEKHRTWVVYSEGAPDPISYLEFKVGDAFRLSVGDDNKFKFKPLRKLENRWGKAKFVEFDNAPGEDLLCAQLKLKKNEDETDFGPWLAIDTQQDDVLTLGWVENREDCHTSHVHPGHARAEN